MSYGCFFSFGYMPEVDNYTNIINIIKVLIGKIHCHINLIKESYRTRGKQLRINKIIITSKNAIDPAFLESTTPVTTAITIIIPYSLKKR